MKIFLILIALSSQLAHADFILKSDVGSCADVPRYGDKGSCESVGPCIWIEDIFKYNCAYHVLSGETIVEDAVKKAAYLAQVQADQEAATQERNQRLIRLNFLRNRLTQLDAPLSEASIRVFVRHLTVEEIRRLRRELE